ncbi:immunoglobulin gamma-1 heavy chain-like [Heterodontus francisci]|uniref:immunoglobulin gamma-1 heavy chain-like n=1 Tax=Heterodontus francisci TaxID=7792 RepID=UPI00355C1163
MAAVMYLLGTLLLHLTGVLAVPVLNQTPISDPVSAGETSELKCAMQNGNVGSYYMSWYRQRPGEAPVWVLAHYTSGSIYRGTGFTDRFKPSRDTSSNSHILTIGSLEPGDSAVYYCAAEDTSAATYTNRICPDNGEKKLGQIFIFLSTDSVLGIWILEGVLAVPVLNQTPISDPVSAGETSELKCAMQNGNVGSYHMSWYRQRPGDAPVWVLAHYTDGSIYRGTGFTDRFKPSRDTSSNSHILTIGSLEPGDSAVYYCAAWDSSAGYIHSVLAVPVLNQTPISDPVSAGETSELKCAMQNGNVGSYYMSWYRQRPGEAPVWVLAHYTSGSIYRGTGFTDRFKPSRDTSSNSHILTIGSLEPGDSAVYYCAANDGSAGYIHSSEDRKPSVLLLPPSSEEIDSGWATLSCLVSRFKPGFVRVLWRVDDKETDSGVTTGTVSTDSDQTYSLSSYLRVPATAWNKGSSYTCSVDHGSLSSPLLKTISSTACSD